MKRHTLPIIVRGLLLTVVIAAGRAACADDLPPVPETPAPVLDVISMRPFTLEQPATHVWRADRTPVESGWLLVLRVDPALVAPRQTAQPILYVGRQTAERINHGFGSGHVVAIVPAVIDDPKHPDAIDLTRDLAFFGTPGLPEQADAITIARERETALAAGLRPLPKRRVEAALVAGGDVLRVADKAALVREAALLVRKHAPDEEELVESLLLKPGEVKIERH